MILSLDYSISIRSKSRIISQFSYMMYAYWSAICNMLCAVVLYGGTAFVVLLILILKRHITGIQKAIFFNYLSSFSGVKIIWPRWNRLRIVRKSNIHATVIIGKRKKGAKRAILLNIIFMLTFSILNSSDT